MPTGFIRITVFFFLNKINRLKGENTKILEIIISAYAKI